MIYELNKQEYEKVEPLFKGLENHPMCKAVLGNLYPGRVFVDNPQNIQAAYLTTFLASEDEGAWGYLVGNPDNDNFNQALNKGLYNKEIIGEKTPTLLLTCHPEDWGEQLGVVFNPRFPIPMKRRHYLCHQVDLEWRASLPEGFTIQQMDKTLLKIKEMKVPDEVRKTIEKWEKFDNQGLKDFGFVAIHQRSVEESAVVAYATVDFVTGGVGDIGFFTLDEYRKQGFATRTVAATLEYGFRQGLTQVNWTCADDNLGSIHIAEKLGLERINDYRMHILIFNEAQSIAQYAYNLLMEGNFQKVIATYDKFFEIVKNPPDWAYIDVTRAWAGLGDNEKAFEMLENAIGVGWKDVGEIDFYEECKNLRNLPQWDAMLEKIKG